MRRHGRRRFLRGSLALASCGLLAGCQLPRLPWQPAPLHRITTDISRPMEARPGRGWWICFAISVAAVLNLLGMVTYLFAKGIGIWGLNNSVG